MNIDKDVDVWLSLGTCLKLDKEALFDLPTTPWIKDVLEVLSTPVKDRIEGDSITPLGMASRSGKVDTVRFLLQQAADTEKIATWAAASGKASFPESPV